VWCDRRSHLWERESHFEDPGGNFRGRQNGNSPRGRISTALDESLPVVRVRARM
jgi:hypothetical protein